MKKFPAAMYALWYPVVERSRTEEMIGAVAASGITDVQRFELGIRADSAERGMTASGMLVVNPPWTLRAKMLNLLPRLALALAQGEGAYSKVEVLVAE